MLGLFPVPLIVIKFKDHHKYDFPEVEKEDRKPFNWVDSVNTSFPNIKDDDPVISPVVRDNLKRDLKDSIALSDLPAKRPIPLAVKYFIVCPLL